MVDFIVTQTQPPTEGAGSSHGFRVEVDEIEAYLMRSLRGGDRGLLEAYLTVARRLVFITRGIGN